MNSMKDENLEIVNASATPDEENPNDDNRGGGNDSKKRKESKTPVLDQFGRNISELVEEGRIDPIIGRGKEVERVSQILSRRKKNNPILIGEPGCVDKDTLVTVKKISDDTEHQIINI